MAFWIAARPSVAQPDVQVAVRAEGQRAAVVVRKRLADLQNDQLAARVRLIGVPDADREARYDGAAWARRAVVDEEVAVARVQRIERQPQQPLLGFKGHLAPDVQKDGGRRSQALIREDGDKPFLQDRPQPVASVPCIGQVHHAVERQVRKGDLDLIRLEGAWRRRDASRRTAAVSIRHVGIGGVSIAGVKQHPSHERAEHHRGHVQTSHSNAILLALCSCAGDQLGRRLQSRLRPDGFPDIGGVVRKARLAAAVNVHDVALGVAVAVGHEGALVAASTARAMSGAPKRNTPHNPPASMSTPARRGPAAIALRVSGNKNAITAKVFLDVISAPL